MINAKVLCGCLVLSHFSHILLRLRFHGSVIASGFAEIVQTKNKTKGKTNMDVDGDAGDDWYDIQYRLLEGQPPPPSNFGPYVDALQTKVKEYLDGSVDGTTGHVSRTPFSSIGRAFFFSLIISNVVAVVLESIPEIDRNVGNAAGNFFDVFEALSVFFFTAGKSKQKKVCKASITPPLTHNIYYQTIFFDCSQRERVERHFTLLGCMQEHSLASLILYRYCRGTFKSC